MNLSEKLLRKVQVEGTCTYAALCQFTLEEGYKIKTMDSKLRKHAEDGLIQPIIRPSKRNTEYISAYTAGPTKKPKPAQIVMINGVPHARI